MVYTSYYGSPIGRILIAGKDDALVGLWLEGQKYFPGPQRVGREERDSHPVCVQARAWLDCYFGGEKPKISELKLAPEGSAFSKAVWDILCQIPYGKLATYGEISRKIAEKMGRKRMCAQAVGGAVGHNPISVIIPCHRVVGSDGSLAGYAGGLDKKIWLLAHEGVDIEGEKLFVPKKGMSL